MHGTNGFDVLEFIDYLRETRNVFLVSCGVAVFLAVGVSLALPKRYTATSSILIEAPAGTDPRAVLTVGSFESFASSDSLFQRTMERFNAEGSKGSVLKVSSPANTTVLDIRATLGDPRKAQAMAQYISEQVVELNNAIDSRATRLWIIEPGIVPQRPSSPNVLLNGFAAFLASLFGAFGFLILRFGYVRLEREGSERAYSLVR